MNRSDYEQVTDNFDPLSYDSFHDCFELTILDDVDKMFEEYQKSPIVRMSVDFEISEKRDKIHGMEPNEFTTYSILGFFHQHRGEQWSIDNEYLGIIT
jgi:hypothetical protein